MLKRYGHWPVPQICRIVMIAADVPEKGHVLAYADVAAETELHIVQNQRDYALVASSLMRGLRTKTRLGQLARSRIKDAYYHDFSG